MSTKGDEWGKKKLQQILLLSKPLYRGGTQESRQIFFFVCKKKGIELLTGLASFEKYRCSVKFCQLKFLHTF